MAGLARKRLREPNIYLMMEFTLANCSSYGTYAQIDDKGSFVNQMTSVKNDVVASKAVWTISLMPTISGGFKAVTDAHCQKAASIIQDYVNSGVEVWLRFGHEMNWYVQDGTYHGSKSTPTLPLLIFEQSTDKMSPQQHQATSSPCGERCTTLCPKSTAKVES